MSGIFRNLSNSGRARFRNISNSGRGVFYGPGSPIGPGGTTTTTTTTSTTTTTTTTTPPVILNSITYGYNALDADQACTNYETNVFVTKYNDNNDASGNGVVVWNNSNGTGVPSDGYYARGINVWYMTNGILGNQAICYSGAPTTTTTSTTTTTTTSNQVRIDWNLSEEGSGAVRLVIRNSLNVIVLDEESVGGVPSTGGTIYLSESETPYSITVSVAAGTEVAQYRICNSTPGGTEITLNTNVPVSSTYTVSPTPTWSTIYATYGNTNTPINCPVE